VDDAAENVPPDPVVEAYKKAVSEAVRTKFEAVLADFKSGKTHLEMPVPQN